MFRIFLSTVLVCNILLADNEPSVFGAGNIDEPNPYGLNDSEKGIVENKKELRALKLKLEELNTKLQASQILNSTFSKKLLKLDKKNSNEQFDEIRNLIQEYNKENTTNLSNLKSAIKELSLIVDDINKKFVSTSTFEEVINRINAKISNLSPVKVKPKKAAILDKTDKKLNNWDLQEKANNLYKKKKYSSLEPIAKTLMNKNFKPAKNSFYLGEVFYSYKEYADAIDMYKKSLAIYDQASYSPKLLLHAALSFQKLKDNTQYKKFLKVIVVNFPKSDEAKIAKKRLKT